MEISEESVTTVQPASNPNNCGKRFYNFSGCTEYRAAFNWPPGSQQTTPSNQQIVNSGGPSLSTTFTTTQSINLDKGIKSQTIADFSEISATSNTPAVVTSSTNYQYQPAKSTTNQPISLAPGPAGLPSHCGAGGEKIKDRPQVLFTRATPSPPIVDPKPGKPINKTEYKKKFKPFSTYVYIPGSGWKKSKQATKESDGAVGFTNGTGRSTSEGALEWYGEVVERAKKACEFRSRSQFGHPIVGVDHLESIYRETNLWNQPKDRSIAALALATSHHLRVSTRSIKGNSRDSSRDSSKAASDRVTSNHSNANVSPSKETQANKKQLADKSKSAATDAASVKKSSPRAKSTSGVKGKPSTEKKRSSGLTAATTTPPGAKSTSVDSEGGKIWLKPKKEDKKSAPPAESSSLAKGENGNGEKEKKDSLGGGEGKDGDGDGSCSGGGDTPATNGASSLVTSGSLTPALSPREKDRGKEESIETGSNTNTIKSPNTSDDQPRSPRPNSLVSSVTTINGGSSSGLSSPPSGTIIPEGPVKTTEIKSPEEVTGVKSPSPELWRVSIEPGADINWTEAKPSTTIPGNSIDNINKDLGDNDFTTIETNASNLGKQLDETTINSKSSSETQEITKNNNNTTSSSETNEDLYGPLSI